MLRWLLCSPNYCFYAPLFTQCFFVQDYALSNTLSLWMKGKLCSHFIIMSDVNNTWIWYIKKWVPYANLLPLSAKMPTTMISGQIGLIAPSQLMSNISGSLVSNQQPSPFHIYEKNTTIVYVSISLAALESCVRWKCWLTVCIWHWDEHFSLNLQYVLTHKIMFTFGTPFQVDLSTIFTQKARKTFGQSNFSVT